MTISAFGRLATALLLTIGVAHAQSAFSLDNDGMPPLHVRARERERERRENKESLVNLFVRPDRRTVLPRSLVWTVR